LPGAQAAAANDNYSVEYWALKCPAAGILTRTIDKRTAEGLHRARVRLDEACKHDPSQINKRNRLVKYDDFIASTVKLVEVDISKTMFLDMTYDLADAALADPRVTTLGEHLHIQFWRREMADALREMQHNSVVGW